jgi:F-type H+-transporting ATPase subunit epsilon
MIVDIVTPLRNVVVGVEVNSLKLPAIDGEIQILSAHTELLTILGTGPLSFVQDGRERVFAVSYGFAEVRKDKILVLAESAEEAKEIDRERAKVAEKRAQEALLGTLSTSDFKKHSLKLQRALVRQQVASHH